jgi:hypothetical protein
MDAGSAPAKSPDGYNGAAVAGAVLGTLLFPFISLIAALLLQGSQPDPQKRAQLRTWAWVSGGWLAFGAAVTVILALVTVH